MNDLSSVSKPDILLVDDHPENLRLLTKILSEEGYKLRKATTGSLALRTIQFSKPDLVLLDVNLPDINGYDVCRQLKASEETQDIPVIFLSALNEVLDKVKAFEVGGSDYITKSFRLQELLVRVRNQLSLSQQRKEIVEQKTKLEEQNAQLQLLLSTIKVINDSPDFQSALTATIHQVCGKIGWDYGEFWIPDNDETGFEYGKGWYVSEASLEEFRHQSETLTWTTDRTLQKLICFEKQPRWLADVSADPNTIFYRSELAKEAGLKACLGVPILFNNQVIAVLMFLKKEAAEPEPQLIELVNVLATQLSTLIGYKQAEAALRQSEARFQRLAENVPGVIYQYCQYPDGTDQFTYVSPGIRDIYEFEPEAVQKSAALMWASVCPEDLSTIRASVQHSAQTLEPWRAEWRMITPSGVLKWLKGVAKPERQPDGTVLWDGLLLDVSQRKFAEEALFRQEQQFRTVAENSPDIISRFDRQLRHIYINPAVEKVMGIPCQELIGKTLSEVGLSPQLLFLLTKNIQNVFDTAQAQCVEFDFATPAGLRNYQARLVPECAKDGRVEFVLVVTRDITELKQVAAELHNTQRFLNSLLENLPVGVFAKDAQELRFVFWNQTSTQLMGYSAAEAIGKTDYDLFPAEQADICTAQDREALIRKKLIANPAETVHTHCGERIFNVKKIPIFDEVDQPQYVLGIAEDITEQTHAEAELRRQTELLQTIFDHIPVMVAFYDATGKLQLINRELEQTLGWSLSEPENPHLLTQCYPDPSYRQQVLEFMRTVTGRWQDFKTQTREGRLVDTSWINILLSDGTKIGIGQDITERKQAEEALRTLTQQERERALQLEQALGELQRTQTQLVQNEKMVSLGQLVAGVAHEINSPISFIACNIQPAREYIQDLLHLLKLYQQQSPQPAEITQALQHIDPNFIAEDFPKLLASIEEGAEQISQIVQSLRDFSRLDQRELKRVDIHQGIDNTLLILGHRLKQYSSGSEIQVIKNYGSLPSIECYPSSLNQVFMNIITNAIDALEEGIGYGVGTDSYSSLSHERLPTIRIQTAVIEPNRVAIQIADNGLGMTAEVHSRIFDPFFTTKLPGKGTGLGLSIAYQIVVNKHGGQLMCHSAPGQGTEVVIELPLTQRIGS